METLFAVATIYLALGVLTVTLAGVCRLLPSDFGWHWRVVEAVTWPLVLVLSVLDVRELVNDVWSLRRENRELTRKNEALSTRVGELTQHADAVRLLVNQESP
jgi:hypothetical protein